MCRRLHAHPLAVALEHERFDDRMQAVAPSETHHADGFRLRAAARTGDARDRQRDLSAGIAADIVKFEFNVAPL